MTEIARALRLSRLFAEVPSPTLLELAEACSAVHVQGGQALFRQGEGGDAMYVVAAGRLQVLEESISERRRVGLLGPGDHVGDWALLTGEPRTATVAALRDSMLIRVDRGAFERFVATSAKTAMRLATQVVERRVPSNKRRREEQEPVRVVALLPTCAHPDFPEVCRRLEQALSDHGAVAVLQPQQPAASASLRETGRQLGRTLDALEERARFVLGVCDPEASGWTRALLRQADAVVVVGLGDDPRPGEAEASLRSETESFVTRRIDLLRVRGAGVIRATGTRAWAERRRRYGLHHARIDEHAGFRRLARRLAGCGVGVAIGGSGVHALVHAGVALGLHDAGITVDALAGSSTGATLAALWAADLDPDERDTTLRELEAALADSLAGLLEPERSADRVAMVLDAAFGSREFEDLDRPCLCVASDLRTASPAVLRRGSVARAALAAMAIPALHPPQIVDGRLLADGAILRAVPADLLLAKIAGLRVLAVDARPRTPAEIVVPEQIAAVRLLDLVRLSLGGHEGGLRQVHDALLRSATLAAAGHARATLRQEAAFLLQIDLGEVGTLERGHRKELIRLGVDAVRLRADALRNVLRPRPRRR